MKMKQKRVKLFLSSRRFEQTFEVNGTTYDGYRIDLSKLVVKILLAGLAQGDYIPDLIITYAGEGVYFHES